MLKYLLLMLSFVLSQYVNAKVISVEVKDSAGNLMPHVVIYAIAQNGQPASFINDNQLLIEQKNKKFSPYIAVTQKGRAITFENKDDITHHIYSVSGKNNFEFKVKAEEKIVSMPLNAVEEVAMGCNIHDWMSGYVLIVDTPYFNQTNPAGITQLDLASDGKYSLYVWHPQLEIDGHIYEDTISIDFRNDKTLQWHINVPALIGTVPTQENTNDFEFLEEY